MQYGDHVLNFYRPNMVPEVTITDFVYILLLFPAPPTDKVAEFRQAEAGQEQKICQRHRACIQGAFEEDRTLDVGG